MRPPTVFVEKKIKLSKLRTSWVFNQSLGSALQGHSKLLCFHSRGSPVLLWWDEDRCFTGTHHASACWGENRVFTSTLPSSCSYGIFILAIRSENWSWLFLCLSVRVVSFVTASSASPKLGHVSYTCVLRTEKDSSVPLPSFPSPPCLPLWTLTSGRQVYENFQICLCLKVPFSPLCFRTLY